MDGGSEKKENSVSQDSLSFFPPSLFPFLFSPSSVCFFFFFWLVGWYLGGGLARDLVGEGFTDPVALEDRGRQVLVHGVVVAVADMGLVKSILLGGQEGKI
jgi:hypothetical protein